MSVALRSIQPAPRDPTTFVALLDRVHEIGRDVVAPQAESVHREARFPHEALTMLKAEELLSAYIPVEYGGLGLDVTQIARIREALGQYCASTAMIFAMHQIQVACIVHHALGAPFFRDYAREIAAQQNLLASAATELGGGGDVRSSSCAVRLVGGYFILEKQAAVISCGEMADAILVTCRRSEEAARNDQVQVLVRREDCTLKRISQGDRPGLRRTCSPGFELKSIGRAEQILPVPYAEIRTRTMIPFAHKISSPFIAP